MKTGLLICVCTLTVVTFAAGKTYACNLDPVASLSADPNPVCVGQSVTLDGSGSSDPDGGNGGLLNGIKKFEWDWTNDGSYDYSESPGDGIATHTYTIAGTYTAKLRVTDNDAAEGGPPDKTDTATRTVYVVEVDRLQYNDPDTGYTDISGTLYVYNRYNRYIQGDTKPIWCFLAQWQTCLGRNCRCFRYRFNKSSNV